MHIKTADGCERSVASQGLAGTALGLGIAGTVGLLNQFANNGFGLGNGFGFGFGNGFGFNRGFNNFGNGLGAAMAVGYTDAVASNDTRIIACQQSEIDKLKSEKYTDTVGTTLYSEVVRLSNKNDEKIQADYRELAKFIAELSTKIAVDKKETECNFAFLNHRIDDANCKTDNAIAGLKAYVDATFVPGELKMPLAAICPEAMRRYNSWVAPTNQAPDTQPVTVVNYTEPNNNNK